MIHSSTRRLSLTLLGLFSLLAIGCQASPVTASHHFNDYQSGNYQQAYQSATRDLLQQRGLQKDQATYIAGMSAYRLGHDATAQHYLTRLVYHTDPSISGPSNATVGLILSKKNRHLEASTYLQRATKRLANEDLARAYFHLALAEQKANRPDLAQAHFYSALTKTKQATFSATIRHYLKSHGYTLQLGAYRKQANAETLRRTILVRTQSLNLGRPRIAMRPDATGSPLYFVYLGDFANYRAALSARYKLGHTDAVIIRKPS